MTAVPSTATAVITSPTLKKLPLIGALLALAALAVSLLTGHDGPEVPAIGLGVGALVVLATEIMRRMWQILRAPEGLIVVLVGLAIGAVFLAWVSVASSSSHDTVAFVLGALGAFLAGIGISRLRAVRRADATPWAELRGASRQERARLLFRTLGPLLTGIVVILLALQLQAGEEVALAVAIIVVLFAVRHVRTQGWPWAAPRRSESRSQDEVAAHLHDSVLQTLALIQRSSADPARVAQLARQQERSLRDWLAGRSDDTAATLPAALRLMAAEVEQEIAGATIDVVCVGTAPMDRRVEMLTQAAREAMRNAARHGSPKVRVFCEIDERAMTVFVRDGGSGLSLDEIPSDRRGIRDAIIGRMEHVDGTVSIESGEHGTEIELRLPVRST